MNDPIEFPSTARPAEPQAAGEAPVGISIFSVHQHMRLEAVVRVFEGFGEMVRQGGSGVAQLVRERIDAAEELAHYLHTGQKPPAEDK